jgi:hypothetical protein
MTVLLELSGLFKIVESFAVFVCLVLHRIGYRGSQVRFKKARKAGLQSRIISMRLRFRVKLKIGVAPAPHILFCTGTDCKTKQKYEQDWGDFS